MTQHKSRSGIPCEIPILLYRHFSFQGLVWVGPLEILRLIFRNRGCRRFMDVNADLRQLSSAELLLLLHNIWVELHNRLNFQPAASTNPEPANPGFTEESFVPHSCDQYCDWCRRWCTRHKAGHRHHTCFERRHRRG